MDLCFSQSEICQWAEKYKKNNPKPYETELKLIALKPKIEQRGYLDKEELQRVARWKSQRKADNVDKNDCDYVKEITGWAFTTTNERSKIEVLTLLDGVGWPTASAILHLFHKDRYPILDVRALYSVGVLESIEEKNLYKYCSFSFWRKYVCFCRDVANRNQVDMRTLDRALWQYSKSSSSQ